MPTQNTTSPEQLNQFMANLQQMMPLLQAMSQGHAEDPQGKLPTQTELGNQLATTPIGKAIAGQASRIEAHQPKTKTEAVPLNLSAAIGQLVKPEFQQLSQLAGQLPGVNAYPQNLPAGLEGVIQNTQKAEQGYENQMPTLLQQQVAGAGNAAFLTDLLNAARYQAIYKGTAFGAPTGSTSSPEYQLYNKIAQTGGALGGSTAGAIPGLLPAQAAQGAAGATSAPSLQQLTTPAPGSPNKSPY